MVFLHDKLFVLYSHYIFNHCHFPLISGFVGDEACDEPSSGLATDSY